MLYSFFCVFPRRLNFMCRRFGTLFHLHMWCFSVGRFSGVWIICADVWEHTVPSSWVVFFCWAILRLLNCMCRRFGTLFLLHGWCFSVERFSGFWIVWTDVSEHTVPSSCVVFFCWVIPRRLNSMYRRSGTLSSIFICGVFSVGWSRGVWTVCADVSEHSVSSIFVGVDSPASELYVPTFQNTVFLAYRLWRWSRVFLNVGIYRRWGIRLYFSIRCSTCLGLY